MASYYDEAYRMECDYRRQRAELEAKGGFLVKPGGRGRETKTLELQFSIKNENCRAIGLVKLLGLSPQHVIEKTS